MLDREPNDDQPKLKWGYSVAVPEGAKAAWGARLILEQNADTQGGDLLHDRQDSFYETQAHGDLLQAQLSLARPWQRPLAALVASGQVRSDVANEVVVFENDSIKAVGNSNGSYGYFYIAVWLK